jgi:glycogen debranching enzyme
MPLAPPALREFRLEAGLPVWRYEIGSLVIEKRILMPHRQNTLHVTYRLLASDGPVRLTLRPSANFRPHEAPVGTPLGAPYTLTASAGRYERIRGGLLTPVGLRSLAPGDPEYKPQ